jgi:aspartate/methionine/tyrosine aminotransferase
LFSARVPRDLAPNALARARAAVGDVPFDLTAANPTACGFAYPERLLEPLASCAALVYRPDPLGLRSAREAVASYYAARGAGVDPAHIVLTASSSEAYGFLFKLLCDPGDGVLVPVPSYPLFEHLAGLEAVAAAPWPLDPDAGWQPDFEALARRAARAAIVVHPNNPTGTAVTRAAREGLAAACRAAETALIVDEVFLDYPLAAAARFETFAAEESALTFTLGGLSKSLGLPQLKLSWIVASGPAHQRDEALRRLEFIADGYLSVATPVQVALPALLRDGAVVRARILARCRSNLAALVRETAHVPSVSLETPHGGWSAVLRYPAVCPEERLALELLVEDGVAVHPGFFFDFPAPARVVLSLLPEERVFVEGVARLLRRIAKGL